MDQTLEHGKRHRAVPQDLIMESASVEATANTAASANVLLAPRRSAPQTRRPGLQGHSPAIFSASRGSGTRLETPYPSAVQQLRPRAR
jgi:hypothetical protein